LAPELAVDLEGTSEEVCWDVALEAACAVVASVKPAIHVAYWLGETTFTLKYMSE
jgi:hypothetical protein